VNVGPFVVADAQAAKLIQLTNKLLAPERDRSAGFARE
jgi:hypothetical protein